MIERILLLFMLLLNISYGKIILHEKKEYDNFTLNYSLENIQKIEDIKNQDFIESTKNSFALGHKDENIWFKLDLINKSKSSKYILKISESFYEEIELYYKMQDTWKKQKDGFLVPVEEKSIYSSTPLFKLDIPIDSKKTYYLRLKTKFSKFGELTIYEQNYFFEKKKSYVDFLFIFSFGVILIIIVFTLFLVIKIKDKIYIYYLGYTIFYFIYVLNHSGLLSYINLSKYTYEIQALSGMIMVFLILFSTELLNIKKTFPKVNLFFKTIAVMGTALAPLYIIYYEPFNQITNNLFIIVMLMLILSFLFIKKNEIVKYYSIAVFIYFSSIIIFLLMTKGIIPYSFSSRYGYIITSIIEIIIFSLILATRYDELKNKTIKISNDLLKQKDKARRALQKEVKKQTEEILKQNIKLENLLKERDLLLKEVYHRVKNNFQVVIGLLWFEGKKFPNAKQSYLELINRIKSMSTVHEYLYSSKDLSHIELDVYLHQIINNLQVIYEKKEILIDTDIKKVNIEFNDAITLGMIVNEVLSNSIKHHNKNSKCTIKLIVNQKDDFMLLSIKDNGTGFDSKTPKQGIGLNLIKDFAKKLSNSTSSFKFDKGTIFELSFENKQK